MTMDVAQSILRSILINKKVGTKVSSKKFNKLSLWKDEITPYLTKLQEMGYISDLKKSLEVVFTIKKPITLKTIDNL